MRERRDPAAPAMRLFAAGGAAFLLLWGASTLWWPMGRDQGVFGWVGDTILRGGLPYRDAWEQKGPATHYTYALVEWALGRNQWGVRLFDLLLLGAALAAAWRLVNRVAGRSSAALTVAVLALWYAGLGFWYSAQPDDWAALLLVVAVALRYSPGRRRMARAAVIGACVAICVLYKPLFAVFALVLLPGTAVRPRGPGRPALVALATSSGALALAVVWFAAHGALGELVQIQLRFNLASHSLVRPYTTGQKIRTVWEYLTKPETGAALSLGVYGVAWLWRRHRPLALTLVVWAALAVGVVVGQGKFFPYHWVPLFPPIAMAAGVGLGRLWCRSTAAAGEGGAQRWFAAALTCLLLAVNLRAPASNLYRWGRRVAGRTTTEQYDALFDRDDFSYRAEEEVARYVARRTPPGATVLVWGFEPLVNYLSGRASPTRFGSNYPLVSGLAGSQRRYRREFLRDLRRSPPAYVLIVDRDANLLLPTTSRQAFEDFEPFSSYVRAHYVHETTIEDFDVLRRVDGPP